MIYNWMHRYCMNKQWNACGNFFRSTSLILWNFISFSVTLTSFSHKRIMSKRISRASKKCTMLRIILENCTTLRQHGRNRDVQTQSVVLKFFYWKQNLFLDDWYISKNSECNGNFVLGYAWFTEYCSQLNQTV